MTKLHRSAVIGALVLMLSGCAVTELIQDGDVVSRSYQLGTYEQPTCDPERSSLFRTTVYGFGAGTSGATLGYAQNEVACVPFECKAVFWVKDPAIIEEVRTLIGDNKQMCAVSETGEQVK